MKLSEETSSQKIKRILLLTYAFPPMQAAETFLCVKALGALENIEVDVLTLNPNSLGLPEDHSLDGYIEQRFSKVIRVLPPRWVSKKIFSWFRYLSLFPDRYRLFNGRIVAAAQNLNLAHYDLLMSRSQWHSIHLAALEIKRLNPELPWVAHLSDPWSDNPFMPKIPFFSMIQRKMERAVINSADQIHFTTHETVDLVMKKYPKCFLNKIHVLPHTYDENLYIALNPSQEFNAKIKSGTKTVRYLGNFYGPRNPKEFLYALGLIYKDNPEILNDIKFEFVGRWVGSGEFKPFEYDLPIGLVEFKAPVSYLNSLVLMRDADMLLILDAPFDRSIFFPSKLVDYIGSGRPIAAFTPPGCCADILAKMGGLVCSPGNRETIKRGLLDALYKLQNQSLARPNKELAEIYSSHNVSGMYIKSFNALRPRLFNETHKIF